MNEYLRTLVGLGLDPYNPTSDNPPELMSYRERLVRYYAWGVPNDEAVGTVTDLSPVLEVGAGTGYWARLVRDAGGDILPTDLSPPFGDPEQPQWIPVWKADAREVAPQYEDHALFMCWPDHGSSWPVAALGAYGSAGGETFVYVGEPEGGLNADGAFFRVLGEDWRQTETVEIPTYPAVHDRMRVYNRR